jgi:hypothetical protein
MLSDFLLLESYYGDGQSAQFIEDFLDRYGQAAFAQALMAGQIMRRRVMMGPDQGRWLVSLTEKGRSEAGLSASRGT